MLAAGRESSGGQESNFFLLKAPSVSGIVNHHGESGEDDSCLEGNTPDLQRSELNYLTRSSHLTVTHYEPFPSSFHSHSRITFLASSIDRAKWTTKPCLHDHRRFVLTTAVHWTT
jgi:hypothetical protein